MTQLLANEKYRMAPYNDHTKNKKAMWMPNLKRKGDILLHHVTNILEGSNTNINLILSFAGHGCPDAVPLANGTGKVNGRWATFECNDGFADPATNLYMELVNVKSSCTCESWTWPKPSISCEGNVTL